MTSTLEDRIRADLSKAGMLSELLAQKTFDNAGWNVSGPGAYFDREEEKSREGDFYATRVLSADEKGAASVHCEFSVVAEVKKSERPWVVFKRDLAAYDRGCGWNNLIARINMPCSSSKFFPCISEFSLLNVVGWEGAGVHESFKSPDQPSKWYSAFVSSLKWASQLRDEIGPDSGEIQKDLKSNPTEFYFFQPLVVLDGLLFCAEVDEHSQIQISKIASAPFRFSYESKSYERSSFRVDLVTIDGLPEYIDLQKKRHQSIMNGLMKEIALGVSGIAAPGVA